MSVEKIIFWGDWNVVKQVHVINKGLDKVRTGIFTQNFEFFSDQKRT
jgi:hypothetical protein